MEKQKLEILLVQDNPPCFNTSKWIIEKSGHSVTPAGNGVAAIKLNNKSKFDYYSNGNCDADYEWNRCNCANSQKQ